MRETQKKKEQGKETDIYQSLAKMTEEMYFSFAKAQSLEMQKQLFAYHEAANDGINTLLAKMNRRAAGELLQEYQRKLHVLEGDFSNLKDDLGTKYKVYLRGLGKAGKSTLLNALLSIDESHGSKMGITPMTFTIDSYTDELAVDRAEIRKIDAMGRSRTFAVSRQEALRIKEDEELRFQKSKLYCDELIRTELQKAYLEEEREDIKHFIYKKHLLRTEIRETRWGIEKNNFFHNCVLIDTPGLEQEFRFTNVIEDVKNYEVDGIIWVISSDTMAKQEVIDAYYKEFEQLKGIYEGKKVIAVINMYGTGEEYVYGSPLWNRVRKRAEAIYCGKYQFDGVICVNARLAYDGNLKRDEKMLVDSNISELRKKINQLFVEKTTQEHWNSMLEKVDMFLSNLYREVQQQADELQKKVDMYDTKNMQITSLKRRCANEFSNQREKIVFQYMAEVRNRIELNASRVSQLDYESSSDRQHFLEHKILDHAALKDRMDHLLKQQREYIFGKFREQQENSIISEYRTRKYVLQSFQRSGNNVVMRQSQGDIVISTPTGIGAGIFNAVKSTFGSKSIFTRGVKAIRDMFTSPTDRLYRELDSDIRYWAGEITLDDELDKYEKQCCDTLDKSMEHVCGRYMDIKTLVEFIHDFIEKKPRMVWKKVGVLELLEED